MFWNVRTLPAPAWQGQVCFLGRRKKSRGRTREAPVASNDMKLTSDSQRGRKR